LRWGWDMGAGTFLLVDDNPDNLFSLEQVLLSELPDAQIVRATRPEEALALAREKAVDVALVDLKMPGMDGIELCKRLKADGATPSFPIVLVTAHETDSALRAAGLEAGADDFLSKPIDRIELIASIRVMRRIKRGEDQLRRLNAELEDLVAVRTASLRESEERFRRAILEAPIPIMICAEDGEILQINRVWTELTGYALQDLPTYSVWAQKAYRLRSALEAVEAVRVPCVGQRSCQGERAIRPRSGEERVWDFSSSAIGHLADGRRLIVTMATDMTDRRRAEEEKRQLEGRVRQAEKMAAIGELAAGMAHNINNHLAPILGNAEMLQASPQITREQAEMRNDIMGASRRAADLIDQLLAFARKGRFQSGPVDMHQVIREATGLPRPAAGVPIEVTLDLRAEESDFAGDPSQLQNAVLNLILNACDAMPQGGELTISTDCVTLDEEACRRRPYAVKPGRYLQVSVADTGIGMDKETKARIFQPFFTTKEPGKGTGLGLASVYGCVKGHGGLIEVDSTPGHGTTFDLFFPLAPAGEAAPASAGRRHGEAGLCPGEAGPSRILCLDHETPLVHLTAKVLERRGYTVTSVSTAEEAIEHYRRHQPDVDLVVLDFETPGASGLEVLHQLKAINPEVHILMTALNGADKVAGEALSEGAIGVLTMPLEIQRLTETVAEYVRLATGTPEREAEPARAGKALARAPLPASSATMP